MVQFMEPAYVCSGLEVDDAFEHVKEHYRTRETNIPPSSLTFSDTFDWRLYRGGRMLLATPLGDRLLLSLSHLDGREECKIRVDTPPGFEWDLPESEFRSAISPLTSVRRLLPLARAQLRGRRLELLNSDQKTTVRFEVMAGMILSDQGETELPPFVRIRPLKGYASDAQELIRFIQERTGCQVCYAPLLKQLLETAGNRPLSYTSKLRIQLDSGMSTHSAARKICQVLLSVIRSNENGVRKNLDTEFLHDFRVAVRRTRAALSQLKRVFSGEVTRHFRKEFSWLGRTTGPTRDLDVYLLKMGEYRSSLPVGPAEHLDKLAEFLTEHHKTEHRRLVRALNSSRYRRLLVEWEALLSEPTPGSESLSSEAAAPILKTANSRIYRTYRRILKKGSRVEDETPPEALHELRIEAKKLRYLMEFFRSLYQKKQVSRLIKALRRLQDNLGDFNDYHLQQVALYGFAEQLLEEGNAEAETLMAMGRLVDRLEVSQEGERKKFREYFERFSSQANRDRFDLIFRS